MPCPSSLGVPGRVLEHRVPGPPGPEPLHLEEGSRWRTWLPTGLLALGPEQGPGCCVGPKGRSFLPLPEDALGTAGYRPGCCPPLPLPAAQLCLSVPQPRLCGVCSCSGSENRVLDPPPARATHRPSRARVVGTTARAVGALAAASLAGEGPSGPFPPRPIPRGATWTWLKASGGRWVTERAGGHSGVGGDGGALPKPEPPGPAEGLPGPRPAGSGPLCLSVPRSSRCSGGPPRPYGLQPQGPVSGGPDLSPALTPAETRESSPRGSFSLAGHARPPRESCRRGPRCGHAARGGRRPGSDGGGLGAPPPRRGVPGSWPMRAGQGPRVPAATQTRE